MEIAFSGVELGFLVAGLVLASIIAGFMAGFLGVGGGIVIVPALFWLFTFINFPENLAIHMSVATSLGTIIFTSISSMRAHYKRGAVDMPLLRKWAPGVALGALTGGLASRYIDPSTMKGVFGVVALIVAVNFATPRTLVLAPELPKSNLIQMAISAVIGFLSSLMGIGGGTLSVPTLAAFSFPIIRAVGTAAAFGLIIAIPAVIGFMIAGQGVPNRPPFSLGYVNLAAVAIIIPFTTFFAPYGAKAAHSVDALWVKRGFGLFLAITAIRMLASAFG